MRLNREQMHGNFCLNLISVSDISHEKKFEKRCQQCFKLSSDLSKDNLNINSDLSRWSLSVSLASYSRSVTSGPSITCSSLLSFSSPWALWQWITSTRAGVWHHRSACTHNLTAGSWLIDVYLYISDWCWTSICLFTPSVSWVRSYGPGFLCSATHCSGRITSWEFGVDCITAVRRGPEWQQRWRWFCVRHSWARWECFQCM